ncbi:MAG: hypothetical protein HOE86_13415, partial [Gemmatimonadetes bacterium]|nr:hypothetical protein [Gemmatimonadota bacterium]
MAYVSVNYENKRYMPEPLRRFATESFEQAGLPAEAAAELAGYLVATDLRGVLSHGTYNVPDYVDYFQSHRYNPKPQIRVVHEAGATIQYDGDGGIGYFCSARSVEAAVDKARQFGVGLAFGRNCGHTGSIGNWTRIATSAGMICLFTSTAVSPSDLVTPQTVTSALMDHPFSMGFPAAPGQPTVVIDMGTLLAPPAVQEQLALVSTLPLIKGLALQTISHMVTLPIAAMQPADPGPFSGATCSLIAVVIDPSFLGSVDDYHTEGQRIADGMGQMHPMPGLDRVVLPGQLEAEREVDFRQNGIAP